MDRDGALSLKETFSMMAGHRCAADPFGVSWIIHISFLSCFSIYILFCSLFIINIICDLKLTISIMISVGSSILRIRNHLASCPA